MDQPSTIEEEEEEETLSQYTKATETNAESNDHQKTDADSFTDNTIVQADNVASEMPETDAISTQIDEVGCLFLTS